MTSLNPELETAVHASLDARYGECLEPSRFNPYETQRQKSWIDLTDINTDRFREYIKFCSDDCYQGRSKFEDFTTLWLIDSYGIILIAIEEGLRLGSQTLIESYPLPRLSPYPEFKLGHPALVDCKAARIGGEISMDAGGQLHLSNKSGRYGVMRTEDHLSNAADLFASLGITVKVQYQAGSWS